MKKYRVKKRWIALAGALTLLALIIWRRNDTGSTGLDLDYDPETTPTMFTDNASSLISDSGYVRYNLEAPVWYVYDEAAKPNWKFNRGVTVEQYDDTMGITGRFVCDSAIYLSEPRLWEFVGNVRVNYANGDRFLTQHLFWDEIKGTISSDSFIHIEKSDRVIEGYGFTSDVQIRNYTLNNPTMIIPVSDFRREHPGQTADTLPATGNPRSAPAALTISPERVEMVSPPSGRSASISHRLNQANQ